MRRLLQQMTLSRKISEDLETQGQSVIQQATWDERLEFVQLLFEMKPGTLADPKEVADCWDWSLAEDGFSGTWAHSLAFLLAEGTARAQVRASLFTWSSPVSTRIGLQYSWERGWGNPEDETARLLAMNEVGKMPKVRYNEMDGLMRSIVTKVSRDWNCQNWVREALGVMVEKGLMTEAEKEKAEEEQRKAIALPFTSETPNKRALKD